MQFHKSYTFIAFSDGGMDIKINKSAITVPLVKL